MENKTLTESTHKFLNTIMTFTKWITAFWLFIWIETILFTQAATILQFGDVASLIYINDNVVKIGEIICGFYFGTKCIENVAKGVESYLLLKQAKALNNYQEEQANG